MSTERSRLVGTMWWVLAATPAVSLAIQISTGYMAGSPDEAGGGLGPDDLLFLFSLLLIVLAWTLLVLTARRRLRFNP